MGEDTASYVLISVSKSGACSYLHNADNILLCYMHASLGAYVSKLLAPVQPSQVVTDGLTVVPDKN